MGVDTTTISGLTKQVYDNRRIENLQNMETALWKRIPKAPKKPSGQGFFMPVNVQGNQRGLGAQNELEALRVSKSQVPLQWRILPKIITDTIRFSGLSMEIASSDVDSFADNYTFQMDEGMKDFGKEENAQLYRSGLGRIAQVNGAASAGSAVTITFDNGVPTHFREGSYVDFVTSGGTKESASSEITAVDIASSTITVATLANNVSDDSFIYREGVADNAPPDGKELAGLPLVVDDGTISATYQNQSRTTYNKLDGISFSAGGANLSNDTLQRAISRVKVISGGRKPNVVVSNTSQMRKYLDILVPLKRSMDSKKFDSGYSEVPTWNGMEWIEDTDCNFDRVYILSLDGGYIEKYEVTPLKYADDDGKVLKWDPGYDAYVCYAKHYINVGSRVPNAHVAITNLNVPTF